MTIQNDHLRTLSKRADWLARRAADDTLPIVAYSELRALVWAVETLKGDVDRAAASSAAWRDQKLEEFEDRRQERRARGLLSSLVRAFSADPASHATRSAAEAAGQYLASRKAQMSIAARAKTEAR